MGGTAHRAGDHSRVAGPGRRSELLHHVQWRVWPRGCVCSAVSPQLCATSWSSSLKEQACALLSLPTNGDVDVMVGAVTSAGDPTGPALRTTAVPPQPAPLGRAVCLICPVYRGPFLPRT